MNNIFDELRQEAQGLVPRGKEDRLIHLICAVIQRVGHNVGVNGESWMNEVHKYGLEAKDDLIQATAEFLLGNHIDETAHELGTHFE